MNAATFMRCIAEAASIASSDRPPTSSQAATHKADAVVLGAENVRYCMGSKTESGGLIGMDFLRWVSMLEFMESQELDWVWAIAIIMGL